MPDIQAQTADGVTHSFPNGTPPEIIDRAIKSYVNDQNLTAKSNAAARAAGVSAPGVSPPPLKAGMEKAGSDYLASLDPQERYLTQHPEARDRYESGASMAVPTALMGLGTTSPVATIAKKGVAGYLAPVARGVLKSAAGSEAGHFLGEKIGGIFGEEGTKTGGQIGATAGGFAGPFVPESAFAKIPFGIGRMLVSNEGYATELAARKVAQREADINAGLREPYTPPLLNKVPMEQSPIGPQLNPPGDAGKISTRMPRSRALGEIGQMPPQGTTSTADVNRLPPIELPAAPKEAPTTTGRPASIVLKGTKAATGGALGRIGESEEPESTLIVPEPRTPSATDRPGAMWSIPREELSGAAQAGRPGAADVMRQHGRPMIFTPREGVGYGAPRSIDAVGTPEPNPVRQFSTGALGRIGEPAARPTLSNSADLDMRAEMSRLRSKLNTLSDKFSNASNTTTGARYLKQMQATESRLNQIERSHSQGRAMPILRGATREELTRTYSAAPPELKAEADQLAAAYGKSEMGFKTDFEENFGLNRGQWKGLPIKEKFARALSEGKPLGRIRSR